MRAFYESLQKGLGTGLARLLIAALSAGIVSSLGFLLADKILLGLSILVLSAVVFLLLSASLLSFRKSASLPPVPRDDYKFLDKLGLYEHRMKPGYFCGSCKSPLKVQENGWLCMVKTCGQFHKNPDYREPPYQSPFPPDDPRHPDFFG
jgi:hypothetical protein